eukprot:TRINITY_DN1752_c0_g1_i1.p1 TRINITY_DN1752_c0_g1~~TRINITY_DN1752_c0_g1_i1.p1  ORF type:complete len:306 (-),score=77.44 TRINITY_DN1752_c0_g1_i1:217-1134(-)
MTNEQELNSVADKEIFELAEILLALQSRLPLEASETSKTNAGATVEVKKATPTPATPSVSLAAAAAEQVMVVSPPSSPEVQSKKENHAPVTPVTNKRPAPVTASGEATSKKDLTEQERKKRKRVTEEQLTVLETIFATDKMPDQKLRLQLAQRLGMSSRRVQIWFQNKRAKLKKANSNSPSSSPTMGHSIGKLGGSQALYSARFSLPSANNNNASQGASNTKASSTTNTTATVATGSHSNSSSNNNNTNNTNNTSSGSTPTPNLVAPFNFPLSFHPFASSNFLGSYPNASVPGASYSMPISRPVK